MAQTVFNRYEKKYLIPPQKYEALLQAIQPWVKEDKFGSYTIRNLYFDSASNELIRSSIEKPIYKEKFRIRCYGQPEDETKIFLEIKKKYKGLVNKRRITLSYSEAKAYLLGEEIRGVNQQISEEIHYILSHYNLKPKMYLAYDRIAFQGLEDASFRLTFDTGVRSRLEHLTLEDDTDTRDLLQPGYHLMEVKVSNAIPLWFVRILSELEIRSTSFSKYGMFYQQYYEEGAYHYEA